MRTGDFLSTRSSLQWRSGFIRSGRSMLRSLGRADGASLVFKKRAELFIYTITFRKFFSFLQWYPSS